MAYGMTNHLEFMLSAEETNGFHGVPIERTAAVELRPFIGFEPPRIMTALTALPKRARAPRV